MVELSIAKLRECIEKDKEYIRKKLPALEKLKILSHLDKILVKRIISEEFLKQGGLKYLQEYLVKNEDGTYFTFNQIEKVLELLDIMPIEKNHLDYCYILDCIAELSKSKIVSIEIQKKSSKLLNKLTRISTDYELDYSNIQAENKQYIKLFKKNKKNDNLLENKTKYEEINDNRKIPQKSLFDYTIMPESKMIQLREDEKKNIKRNFFNPAKKEGVSSKKKALNLTELD